MPRRVFITVAEVSGDRHAAQLIRSLKQLDPDLVIEGHGGREMAAAGATIHFETVGKAAMGWRGALRAAEIYKVLRWTRRYFDRARPDLLVGVDSPSMNFHFARAAHERGVPVLQYVAPQLWAWAPWRMKKLRRWVDHVACILPFEPGYFTRHGVRATFVGHPIFDELPPNRSGPGKEARGPRFGADGPSRAPVVGLLPGSRKSVARQNFPHLLDVAWRIQQAFPDATFLVPTTGATHAVVRDRIEATSVTGSQPLKIEFAQDRFDEMVPRCDLCVTVSGTATLHVAGFGVPMIVVYRGDPFLWNLAGRWLIRARTYSIVNLLSGGLESVTAPSGRRLVPEFVPWYGSNAPVANLAIEYLQNSRRLAEQSTELQKLIASLDHPGASMNVAKIAMDLMQTAPASTQELAHEKTL